MLKTLHQEEKNFHSGVLQKVLINKVGDHRNEKIAAEIVTHRGGRRVGRK